MPDLFVATPPSRYLLAFDFDGTLFDTSSLSKNGIDVKKSYELALSDLFGQEGVDVFNSTGLQNRTPSELIYDMLQEDGALRRNRFIDSAHMSYEKRTNEEKTNTPWNEIEPEKTIIEILVEKKLEYLLKEVGLPGQNGKVWPHPCGEVLLFLQTIQKIKQEGVPLDTAVISSGHEAFINKTFAAWDVPQPDILITEDDIRPRKYPKEIDRRFKPGQLPLALAHYKWLQQQNLVSHELYALPNALPEVGRQTKSRIMYVGDSISKDMAMADRGGIPGIHVPTTSWEELNWIFLSRKQHFDGRSIQDILFKPTPLEGYGVLKTSSEATPAYIMARR